eukprot:g39854.t1
MKFLPPKFAVFVGDGKSAACAYERLYVCTDVGGGEKNILNAALILWNALSSWVVPYHLFFMEKFTKKNNFDHKSIRKWSACSVLETLREKERVDPVMWFPEQTVKVIWQNASSPELVNKHPDIALSMPPHTVIEAAAGGRVVVDRDHHTSPAGMCLRKGSLEKGAVASVKIYPEQLHDNKELTPIECCRLALSNVRDYVLRDGLKLRAASTKVQWGKTTVGGLPAKVKRGP